MQVLIISAILLDFLRKYKYFLACSYSYIYADDTMKTIYGIDSLQEKFPFPVITMGNFDGVHLGHKEIFKQVTETAISYGGTSIIITFHPHPVHLLHPERQVPMLTDFANRLILFEQSGIDVVLVIEFTENFSNISPEDFILEVLVGKIGAKVIFIGEDFGFGKNRRGNRKMLEKFGKSHGFEVRIIKARIIKDKVVSSTLIRNLVSEGNVAEIPCYLGRAYAVKSRVMHGVGQGAELGFPTANLDVSGCFIPKSGVYIAEAKYNGLCFPGIAYIGTRPTFGDSRLSLEIHLFQDPGNLYGKTLEVRFIKRLRNDIRFDSTESLIIQIRKDIEEAQNYFHCCVQGNAGSYT
jgi:riboflavin kinase / FMN adenylyltransferase